MWPTLHSHFEAQPAPCVNCDSLITPCCLLHPGGKFDGRPVDYALSKFQFFLCSRCKQPYYGGMRECGAAQPPPGGAGGEEVGCWWWCDCQQPNDNAAVLAGPLIVVNFNHLVVSHLLLLPTVHTGAAYDASELVCGSCSAVAAGSNCPEHGTKFVEWKCKYCCSVASWFCWGSTHMCSRCHDHPEQRHHTCPGASRCALKVPHPVPGSTFCLGCGVCRTKDRA